MQFQMQVHSLLRDTAGLADDELGQQLVELVRQAVPKRRAPAVATVARAGRIDVIGLKPVVERKIPVQGFIASLTRADVEPEVGDAHAVGVMGTVKIRQRGKENPVPLAVVFLEWPDNRWWLWRALIDPSTGDLRTDTETLTRAVDGDPMPAGLGRWWSLGRRRNYRVRIRQQKPMVH